MLASEPEREAHNTHSPTHSATIEIKHPALAVAQHRMHSKRCVQQAALTLEGWPAPPAPLSHSWFTTTRDHCTPDPGGTTQLTAVVFQGPVRTHSEAPRWSQGATPTEPSSQPPVTPATTPGGTSHRVRGKGAPKSVPLTFSTTPPRVPTTKGGTLVTTGGMYTT